MHSLRLSTLFARRLISSHLVYAYIHKYERACGLIQPIRIGNTCIHINDDDDDDRKGGARGEINTDTARAMISIALYTSVLDFSAV